MCKCKSRFIVKYNCKDFVLLSPQSVAINGTIVLGIRSRVSLDEESVILPPSHCTSTLTFP